MLADCACALKLNFTAIIIILYNLAGNVNIEKRVFSMHEKVTIKCETTMVPCMVPSTYVYMQIPCKRKRVQNNWSKEKKGTDKIILC